MFSSNLRRSIRSLAPTHGPLACAQAVELNSQVPRLYLVLIADAALLAATHVGSAPFLLTVVVPASLGLISLVRVLASLRRTRIPIEADAAERYLRQATCRAVLFGLIFTAWSLSLLPYGDVCARCHVGFYTAVTSIGCVFCMRHAPRAAAGLTITVVVPFVAVLLSRGEPAYAAIAVNLTIVSGSILFALLKQFADFADLISSREQLLRRQEELEHLSDENLRLANLDSLTGLPNRRSFFAALDNHLQCATRSAQRFGVILIDLDGFKTVNDVHGHAAGDRLLVEAARRLRALEAHGRFFARLGGDEFAAICPIEGSNDELLAFGRALCLTLRSRYQQTPALISGSIGMVAYPDSARTAESLFERADFALHHAKQTSKGCAVLFSSAHESMIRQASLVEHALGQADLERELELAFQPIVDATTGTITAFEALARWDSPLLGRVGPDVFIPAAERCRIVGRLTEILFVKALWAASVWSDSIRIAFNLSALDIESPERVRALLTLTASSGVAPGRVDLEITETAMMRDLPTALASIGTLRAAGFRISLDDFGTGYSSLSQLHVLKPDKVKIDRSFIADLDTRPEARDIVRASVELCRNLGLDSVVEGVETVAQATLLRSLGCRLMQGYYFHRPLDFETACREAEASSRREASGGATPHPADVGSVGDALWRATSSARTAAARGLAAAEPVA